MKRIILLLAVLLVLLSVSCGSDVTSSETYVESAEKTEPLESSYYGMNIDVYVEEVGYFAFVSDVYFYYYDGELSVVHIDNPEFIAAGESAGWENSVFMLKRAEGNEIIDKLTEVAIDLETAGKSDLAKKVNEVIMTIINSGPIPQEVFVGGSE